jgi:hypothetical protein
MAFFLAPLLGMGAGGAAAAGGTAAGAAGGGGLLSGLLGGAGGAGGISALSGAGSGAGPMSQVGAAGAMKLPMGGAGAGGGGFWGQFGQLFKGQDGAQNATAMAGQLLGGGGNSKISTMAQLMRGPTMPFLPHLNTSQVGPNQNPGMANLASLLQQIAGRRG